MCNRLQFPFHPVVAQLYASAAICKCIRWTKIRSVGSRFCTDLSFFTQILPTMVDNFIASVHICSYFFVTIHGVKCLVLQSHDLHAGRLQQSPSSYQDDHERCAAFRPARLHFLRLFYLTLTRSRGTAPLPLPDSHPSAVSMHSSRSIHFSCMSPRSSAVLRSTAHTQRFQTDRIPSSCSLRL